jgi:hypothetical protein
MALCLGAPATVEDRELAVTHFTLSRSWKILIGGIGAVAALAIGALAISLLDPFGKRRSSRPRA